MRKICLLALTAMLCFGMFAFVGCAAASDAIKTITDIAGYADMQAGGDRIDVQFENGTQYGFRFQIEEKTDLDEIVNLVLTTGLTNLGNVPIAPGDNTCFTIYQSTKTYVIPLGGIRVNGDLYVFSSSDLRDKINAIAEAKGAFAAEEESFVIASPSL